MASADKADNCRKSELWRKFCERHANLAAADFAREFRVFVTENPSYATAAARREFGDLFVESFLECFMNGCENIGNNDGSSRRHDRPMSLHNGNGQQSHTIECQAQDSCSANSDIDNESPTKHHKPFFRRLSFKGGLNRVRGIFHKQHSDEVELSSSSSSLPHYHDKHKADKHKPSHEKKTKIVVECKKEGVVNYLSGEDSRGKAHWERCRLTLVKTAGGYMLEFYSPPKVLYHLT